MLQIVFVSLPSTVLNLYCFIVILWRDELRGLEFGLIAIQSASDFLYNGLFSILSFYSQLYIKFMETCRNFAIQMWLTEDKAQFVQNFTKFK